MTKYLHKEVDIEIGPYSLSVTVSGIDAPATNDSPPDYFYEATQIDWVSEKPPYYLVEAVETIARHLAETGVKPEDWRTKKDTDDERKID